jgi:hypothetical protein
MDHIRAEKRKLMFQLLALSATIITLMILLLYLL